MGKDNNSPRAETKVRHSAKGVLRHVIGPKGEEKGVYPALVWWVQLEAQKSRVLKPTLVSANERDVRRGCEANLIGPVRKVVKGQAVRAAGLEDVSRWRKCHRSLVLRSPS